MKDCNLLKIRLCKKVKGRVKGSKRGKKKKKIKFGTFFASLLGHPLYSQKRASSKKERPHKCESRKDKKMFALLVSMQVGARQKAVPGRVDLFQVHLNGIIKVSVELGRVFLLKRVLWTLPYVARSFKRVATEF